MQDINTDISPIYKFDKNQLIGKGQFGSVYKCKNVKNEKLDLVIKRIDLKLINVKIPEIFIYQEINIMKMLNCEHSVKFYESGKTANYYNIVMEYCNGKSLENLIQEKNTFSVPEIKEILTQLNEVFKIMNNKHIIHRDLKPENIFVKYPNPNDKKHYEVKLGDFGMSKQLNNSLQTVTAVGSPIYASPEILRNIISELKIPYNSKSDLWSLGVIIYQLYFGEFPFMGNSLVNLLENILIQKKPPKIVNDKKLQDLLDKIFEVDPNKRISWNKYFEHEFFEEDNKEYYKNIKEFDLGDNLKNNENFSCFVAINKRRNEKVLVKKYNAFFCQKNSFLFKSSIQKSLDLKNNESSLNFKSFYKKGEFWFFEYDFVEGELLSNYIKKKSFNEKDLRLKTQKFFENLINEIDIKKINFPILTTDSILIDKEGNFKLFDFGFLKCFLPEKIQKEYFISSPSEFEESKTNTNVLNFGIILFKTFFKQNLSFTNDKEINLPSKPKISNEFLNFLSHCLYRKNNLRYKWSDFRNDYWLNPEKINKNVLKNENLIEILDYFENKYKIICEYFIKNEDFLMEFLYEKYFFIIFILIEFNMIIKLFDVDKNNFNEQEEFFFLAKNKNNEKYDFASVDLNKFKFGEIFETEDKEKNTERLNLLKKFQKNLIDAKIKENLENLLKKFLQFEEISEYKLLNKSPINFVKNYINYFKNCDFNNLMQDFIKNNKKISQFYCEFIITMQIYLSPNNFKNNNNFEIINKMFQKDNENNILISVVDNNQKNKFLFFSCIGGMFKFYQSSAKKMKKNVKNLFQKFQYEPFLVAYPNILINNLKY